MVLENGFDVYSLLYTYLLRLVVFKEGTIIKSHYRKYIQRKKKRHPLLRKKTSKIRQKTTNISKLKMRISLIAVLILFSVILFLPTMIVMFPFSNASSNTETKATFTENVEDTDKVEVPSFDVAVKRTDTNNIEEVPLETYVTSVVASEMPADFELEALKAQAIAARTYVVNHLLHQENEEQMTMTDTTEHQVYKNEEELKTLWGNDFRWKMDKITNAVTATQNEIITYEEEPITPTFFSMSNGYTEDAEAYWGNELPYLKSVESKWEEDNPKFKEQKILPVTEVANKLEIPLSAIDQMKIDLTRNASHRVSKVTFDDTDFTGREVREKLGLRSNDFSVEQKKDHFIFTTKGFGHGVGMSQYGANGMAKEGNTYEDIIHHYYQDVQISSMTEAAPTLVAK